MSTDDPTKTAHSPDADPLPRGQSAHSASLPTPSLSTGNLDVTPLTQEPTHSRAPQDLPGTVEQSPAEVIDRAARTPTCVTPSIKVPGFVIERIIGRGGMGVVYLARQVGLNRLVALKMISSVADEKGVIRFLAESEIVARVQHENVVEVYQFGKANDQPFLALEYCSGGSLAEQLPHGPDAPKVSPFSPREAAGLVTQIAAGVEAAHALGIVHRDLKPHNVLLTADSIPKVADFGLAKVGAGADLTRTAAVMGTPAYMPPEQARGETKFVGPEADVWALGVILYELLTGRRPFTGADDWATLAAVQRGEFSSVRLLNPAIPRDLEWIVRKCLNQNSRDRYPSAGKMAEDLRNWLASRPIVARPAGRMETAAKWVRRNRALSGAVGAAVMALVVGSAVAVWFGVEASIHAQSARIAAKQAEDDRAEAIRQEGIAVEKANLAAKQEKLANDERAEAKRQEAIAKEKAALAAREQKRANDAERKVTQILDEARKQYESTVDLLETAGSDLYSKGKIIEAEQFLRRSLNLTRKLYPVSEFPEGHPALAKSLSNVAIVHQAQGRLDQAESEFREVLSMQKRLLGEKHPDVAQSQNNLGSVLLAMGKATEAEALFRSSLDTQKRVLGDKHPRVAQSLTNLASILQNKKEYSEAEPLLRQALEIQRLQFKGDHPNVARTLSNLGAVLQDQKKYADAEPLLQMALEMQQRLYKGDHPDVAQSLDRLGKLYLAKEKYADAEKMFSLSLTIRRKLFPTDYRPTGQSLNSLAIALRAQGKSEKDTDPIFQEAQKIYQRSVVGNKEPERVQKLKDETKLYLSQGKYVEADQLFRDATNGEWPK